MFMSSITHRDTVVETHARYIGRDAVLFIGADGTWFVGNRSETISQYRQVRVNGQAVHDDSYEYTALAVEKTAQGYTLYAQSNDDGNVFVAAELDPQGHFLSARTLTTEEFYALETRLALDLNESGGIGGEMVLVDDGLADLYVDGMGVFHIKDTTGHYYPLEIDGQFVSWTFLDQLEIEDAEPIEGGFALIVRDDEDNFYLVEMYLGPEATGFYLHVTPLDNTACTSLLHSGEALGANPTIEQLQAALEQLKTATIRDHVEQAIAEDGKLDYRETVALMKKVIQKTAEQGSLGADLFFDLQALAAVRKSLFISPDLAGQESGYLAYVFDKLVNGSKANATYTGGTTAASNLGNLSSGADADQLRKLVDKWLLGKDLPDPTTQGDTANPEARAVTGSYKAFAGDLFVDGAQAFDVFQGNAGTCYLLAAAAAVAHAAPMLYQHIFVANPLDEEGPTWGVRFFDVSGDMHWVTVNNQLVVQHPDDTQPAYARNMGVNAKNQPVAELWVPLLEKAYAQVNPLGFIGRENTANAMYAIEGGMAEPLFYLTNIKTYTYDEEAVFIDNNPVVQTLLLPENTTVLEKLTEYINTGWILWIGSNNETYATDGRAEFVGGHAYFAWDAEPNLPNNTTLNVFNPWGYSAILEDAAHLSPFQDDLVNLVAIPEYGIFFMA